MASRPGSRAGDWRLPNVREMQSLVDYGRYDPVLPVGHPFASVQTNCCWSSTTVADSTSYAWVVAVSGGSVGAYWKANTGSVWPVRGGQ